MERIWRTAKELRNDGWSSYNLRQAFKAGELIRLSPGLHFTRPPTNRQVLHGLQAQHPSLIFSTDIALSLYELVKLSLPASGIVPRGKNPPVNDLLGTQPTRCTRYREVDGLKVTPMLRTAATTEWEFWKMQRLIEQHYRGWKAKPEFDESSIIKKEKRSRNSSKPRSSAPRAGRKSG